jgi:hypothetical protein
MEKQEIPISQWQRFFDQFSRLHHGQTADIDSAINNEQPRHHARGLSLLGISTEQSLNHLPRIDIVVGDPVAGHVRHAIEHPARVRAAEWNDGVSALLEVESADGATTRLQVGPHEQTLPPDAVVDGLYIRE